MSIVNARRTLYERTQVITQPLKRQGKVSTAEKNRLGDIVELNVRGEGGDRLESARGVGGRRGWGPTNAGAIW